MDNASIKKLESDLWESADLLRAGSKLTSNQYCMPVLGLLFLRYAYSRYKMVEEEILKDRPVRNGRKMPVEASDFTASSGELNHFITTIKHISSKSSRPEKPPDRKVVWPPPKKLSISLSSFASMMVMMASSSS